MGEQPYADLVDAFERGALEAGPDTPGHARTFEHLRQIFTVELGSWERMVAQLLGQLADDVGSVGRGLALLDVATVRQISAWTRSIGAGMRASVRWLASQKPDTTPDVRLRIVKVARGDDYADLVDSARHFRLRGDGRLCPACLQPRYKVALRRSWLKMLGDLLGQVVADAGSYERAAVMLDVREDRLLWWLRWLVSRGSTRAARADWPLGSLDEIDATRPYADLAAVWLRGALDMDDEESAESAVNLRPVYQVRFGDWSDMTGELLEQITADAGSMRKAARALKIPRSTLGARLKRHRQR